MTGLTLLVRPTRPLIRNDIPDFSLLLSDNDSADNAQATARQKKASKTSKKLVCEYSQSSLHKSCPTIFFDSSFGFDGSSSSHHHHGDDDDGGCRQNQAAEASRRALHSKSCRQGQRRTTGEETRPREIAVLNPVRTKIGLGSTNHKSRTSQKVVKDGRKNKTMGNVRDEEMHHSWCPILHTEDCGSKRRALLCSSDHWPSPTKQKSKSKTRSTSKGNKEQSEASRRLLSRSMRRLEPSTRDEAAQSKKSTTLAERLSASASSLSTFHVEGDKSTEQRRRMTRRRSVDTTSRRNETATGSTATSKRSQKETRRSLSQSRGPKSPRRRSSLPMSCSHKPRKGEGNILDKSAVKKHEEQQSTILSLLLPGEKLFVPDERKNKSSTTPPLEAGISHHAATRRRRRRNSTGRDSLVHLLATTRHKQHQQSLEHMEDMTAASLAQVLLSPKLKDTAAVWEKRRAACRILLLEEAKQGTVTPA
jgi:hypothetical protein